ncbi:MAG: hypothetical protein A2Y64_05100 [Candidatus Coatesbacteria bacterium RBG_13_66_14]|uniref:Polymerase/histidinol phosphatase N-terminal domain-containing protein n=1 Tax=Candidatus Coatesbacteria bacterium RBG_13_66_14 TaxID=1817816 RepID=A0A1F5FB40_9BACT|nr:MAG: hypothetical protein A2Y64_05100 [Candidatus Coatesbacteria bacterium RBG_13_66_14]
MTQEKRHRLREWWTGLTGAVGSFLKRRKARKTPPPEGPHPRAQDLTHGPVAPTTTEAITRGKKRRRLVRDVVLALVAAFTLFSLYNLQVQFPAKTFAVYPRLGGYYAYRGVLGVHSRYSDGASKYGEIAVLARKADLDFVVFTDVHSMRARKDGMVGNYGHLYLICGAQLDRPEGKLWILGPKTLPKGLGRSTASICAEVNSKGLSVVAMPLDAEEPWGDWGISNFTALEVVNLRSLWRRADPLTWLGAVSVTLLDGPRSYARLGMDRAVFTLWDELCLTRPVVGLASAEALGRSKVLGDWFINVPSYESAFDTIHTYVLLPRRLPTDPGLASALITGALARGHCFGCVAPIGDGRGFRFNAREGEKTVIMGDETHLGDEPMVLEAYCPPAGGVELRLIRDGKFVKRYLDNRFVYQVFRPGVYRVEAWVEAPNLPWGTVQRLWLFSNPIYIRPAMDEPAAAP